MKFGSGLILLGVGFLVHGVGVDVPERRQGRHAVAGRDLFLSHRRRALPESRRTEQRHQLSPIALSGR